MAIDVVILGTSNLERWIPRKVIDINSLPKKPLVVAIKRCINVI